jgi:hypothetical protein
MVTPLGNDDQLLIVRGDDGIGNTIVDSMEATGVDGGIGDALAGSLEIAVVDTKGAKFTADNVIGVEMDDLSKKDREELEKELQREMEEVMAERRKKKLACFQKTRNGVVKKGDTLKASTLVNSPFTLEELVHMLDVSVNNKYGVDLEVITRTLIESVWGSVESLRLEFKQESKKMPRQIRLIVQQVLGEARDKQDCESPSASTTMPNCEATNPQVALGNLGGIGN